MIRLASFVFLVFWLTPAGAQEAPAADPDLPFHADDPLGIADHAPQPDQSEDASDAPDEPTRLDRQEVRQVYLNYMQAEQFDEAIDAARAGLEMTVAEFGPDHVETVDYLNDLGNALLLTGEPGEARVAFEQSVAIVKNELGVFSPRLIEPLHGLGVALQRLGEHDQAIGNFQYAQHVTHRAEGVNSLNQIRMVEAASRSFMKQKRWHEAENLQLLVYKLYQRAYGPEHVDTIPGMYRLARWYRQVGDYRQSRAILKRSIEIQEAEYGANAPEMIPGLKGLASTYLEENGTDAVKGLRAQQQLLNIVQTNPDRFNTQDQILAHLEMGDWYVQFDEPQDAWDEYRRAWELAQSDQDSPRDWNAYFERPHLIYPGASLALDLMGYSRIGQEVYYDFEFTIAPTGRPQDINILGTNLHGQTRGAALHAFRYARFRPRIIDGEAVATTGYKVRRIYPTEAPQDFGQVSLNRRG